MESPGIIESITIDKIQTIAHWKWRVHTEENLCGLCYSPLAASCPVCLLPGKTCPIVTGKCLHSFHDHCLTRCLDSKPECPFCRALWVTLVA